VGCSQRLNGHLAQFAETLNTTSTAVLPVSTGIYGFPPECAADIVATMYKTFEFHIDLIQLFGLEAEKTATFHHAITR